MMSRFIAYLKALPFWRFIALFVTIAIIVSEIITIGVCYLMHGFVRYESLAFGFFTPAIYGFVVSYILASVLNQLKTGEERLSLALKGANDGLWDWNLDTNETYYSPRWKNMLGYADDELENHLSTFLKLIHPDDKDRVMTKVQDYMTGEDTGYEMEFRMVHKLGHELMILSRAYRVRHGDNGKPSRLVGTHVDITDRKKAEAFSSNTAAILEMIAIGQPAAEIYDEIARMYEARHPGMRCSMLELEGNRLLHGGAPSLPKEYCEAVHGLINGPNVGSCGTSTFTGKRCLVEDIATDPKWADLKDVALPHGMRCCWSEPIKNSSGDVMGAFGMYYNHRALPNEEESQDLTSAARLAGIVMERDQAQKRIIELAYTDELTGLSSRANFYRSLEDLIKLSGRHDRCFALLYIDLDDFKMVNDSLGHDIGDLLLKELANRLTDVGRDLDFIGRLGGDEFCILVEDVGDDYVAALVAQRCLDTLSEPLELLSRKISPTCSIGIAHYPEDGDTPSELIKAADTALYAAKERGKSRYAFYKPELTEKAEYRFQFEHALREAIEKNTLTLAYQPKIHLSTGKIIGVEALSRWHHPILGDVGPTEFIASAERIGMIKPLTEWVLYTACRQAVAWQKQGFDPMLMAVNVSPKHFLDKDIVDLVRRVIDETGIDPAMLELEVTEGAVQTDDENLSTFKALKNFGIQLAIDDFGTGYSSLASLKHLKVDTLKIDKYFIHDMLTDREALLLISSMIEMGHRLGYGIVAEGIETTEQLSMIKKLGSETAQGFLFSQPVTSDEITTLLKAAQTESAVV